VKNLKDESNKRYLLRGFIDGVLSSLGVVIGASTAIGLAAANQATAVIIAAGIGGGVANGFSNILGAFVGEKLVKEKKLRNIENAMLKKGALQGTELDKNLEKKVVYSGLYDGIATILGSLVPVFPFIIGRLFSIQSLVLLYISAIISLLLFFILGLYIGKISKENLIISGLKLVAFGVFTLIITLLIKMLFTL